MFGLFKAKKQTIVSPADGDVVDLSEVPDQVFSEKMAGCVFIISSTSYSDNSVIYDFLSYRYSGLFVSQISQLMSAQETYVYCHCEERPQEATWQSLQLKSIRQ